MERTKSVDHGESGPLARKKKSIITLEKGAGTLDNPLSQSVGSLSRTSSLSGSAIRKPKSGKTEVRGLLPFSKMLQINIEGKDSWFGPGKDLKGKLTCKLGKKGAVGGIALIITSTISLKATGLVGSSKSFLLRGMFKTSDFGSDSKEYRLLIPLTESFPVDSACDALDARVGEGIPYTLEYCSVTQGHLGSTEVLYDYSIQVPTSLCTIQKWTGDASKEDRPPEVSVFHSISAVVFFQGKDTRLHQSPLSRFNLFSGPAIPNRTIDTLDREWNWSFMCGRTLNGDTGSISVSVMASDQWATAETLPLSFSVSNSTEKHCLTYVSLLVAPVWSIASNQPTKSYNVLHYCIPLLVPPKHVILEASALGIVPLSTCASGLFNGLPHINVKGYKLWVDCGVKKCKQAGTSLQTNKPVVGIKNGLKTAIDFVGTCTDNLEAAFQYKYHHMSDFNEPRVVKDIEVHSIEHLEGDPDPMFGTIPPCKVNAGPGSSKLRIGVIQARNIPTRVTLGSRLSSSASPCVVLCLESNPNFCIKTRIIKNNSSYPIWNEVAHFSITDPTKETLKVQICDAASGDAVMATLSLNLDTVEYGVFKRYPLEGKNEKATIALVITL